METVKRQNPSRSNIKKVLTYISIVVGLIFGIFLFKKLVYIDSVTVCAKVIGVSHAKGTAMLYNYTYKGEIYRGSFLVEGGCSMLDCYQKDSCLEIEVSSLIPSFSRLKH